jgi:hypothetical protein
MRSQNLVPALKAMKQKKLICSRIIIELGARCWKKGTDTKNSDGKTITNVLKIKASFRHFVVLILHAGKLCDTDVLQILGAAFPIPCRNMSL